MHSAEDIEIQLWEYMDNVCDEAARVRIAQLIATDYAWKQKYAELTAFNSNLQQQEPEHTSMRFTKNVMESIAGMHVAQPTKSYINKWVVRGIAAMFILLLGSALTYSLLNVQWTSGTPKEMIDYSRIFNGNFISYVIMVNLLVGMVLVDTLLRRKRKVVS